GDDRLTTGISLRLEAVAGRAFRSCYCSRQAIAHLGRNHAHYWRKKTPLCIEGRLFAPNAEEVVSFSASRIPYAVPMSFAVRACHISLGMFDAFRLHLARSVELMEPVVLFGIQFTLGLLIYALIAAWYVAPRVSKLPTALALAPLLWVHALRRV